MYYSTILNKELQYFHNRPVHNFTVKLSQMLTSPLFKVEEIIADSIYKIYPLFYTSQITSSNSNDKILENKCIICQKLESTEENNQETYFTFISDETAEIVDYSEYGTYYEIGDQLTESQFNAYISLLKQNVRHTGSFRISQGELKGSYGTYEFNIKNATIIDNGIVITDETISAQPKVKLSDNVFRWSSYILKLDIIHYTGVNILDDTTSDFKVVETLEIELTPNEWVNIPVESLEQDYIISLDATVEIRHDKTEIHLISGVDITEITSNPIQIGQNTDIYAQLLDTDGQSYDLTDGVGKTVYFYEVLNPILYNLIAEPSIIQTSETTDITVQMKDSDGSKIGAGETVYFYAVEGAEPVPPTPTPVPTNLTLTSDKDILSHYDSDSAVLSATVKDQNGEVMSGQSVVFKKGSAVLATKTTDSNGRASYTYASQGVGDVTLTAECMNLQEIFVLEDCIVYDSLTSASGKWTIPSGVSSSYSSDGWKVSANDYKQIKLTDKLTSACSVEFTVVDYSTPTSSYTPVIVYAYTNGETTPNQMIMMNYPSRIDVLGTSINHALVKGAVYKIEYTASTIKVYENDTLLASASSSVGLPTRFEWHMGTNRHAVYKDLKVKPL